MRSRSQAKLKNRATERHNGVVRSRFRGRMLPLAQRSRGLARNRQYQFMPPENWYEPEVETSNEYEVVVQNPGRGYRHVVSAEDVRERLAEFPDELLAPLQVVQLSRMTRKKRSFPCYGMQWGNSLYLYPVECDLVEHYSRPPRPQERQEATMFGGRWIEQAPHSWRLVWTETAIRDFYLNNVLIHELGHLLDNRNRSYLDRERYAEWFAIRYGYQASRQQKMAERVARRAVRRRHHAK